MKIEPIAYIHNDFKDKFGIPRQSGRVDNIISTVIFEPLYRNPDALREIDGFSHLWLLFDFSLSHTDKWSPTVRPPRLGGNRRVGVFASRSPFRPNSIGLSCVKLISVEKSEKYGTFLTVAGADLIDNTPIYDIKPYLPFCDCKLDATGGYADKFKDHLVKVEFSENTLEKIPFDKRDAIIKCLEQDPKPSYQTDSDRVYKMVYSDFEISFKYVGECLRVIGVKCI